MSMFDQLSAFALVAGLSPAHIAVLSSAAREVTFATVQSDGEPTGVLLAWEGTDVAVIVDAVVCDPATPGRVHRTDTALSARDASARGGTSSHGLGIPDAVALATALDRMPRRLVVYAVEAADVSLGVGLSDEVARAVPALVDQVLAELG